MISDRRDGSIDNVIIPLLLSRGDGEGQRRGKERLYPPAVIPLSEPAEYFLVRLLGVGSWLPKLRRPSRGLEGMLTAPPDDGVSEEDGGIVSKRVSLPEEPPPFQADSNGVEPWL